jgi:glycosyltransferase involved in cell wall biosynthesis
MAKQFHEIRNTPLITVVMPAYQAEAFINYAIDAILNQTYKNFELLIADDASMDATRKLINAYTDPRIKTFHQDINLGYLRTCNNLLSKAQGDLITFQDADDGADPKRLEILLKEFQKDNTLGLCGSQFLNLDIYNNKFKVDAYRALTYEEIVKDMEKCSQFCGATVMVRKEVLNDIGIYRIYFDRLGGEDYDWTLRIVEKYRAKNLPEPLYDYRLHDSPVKIGNVDPRKYYIDDIIHFLAKQRKKYNGEDSLSNPEIFHELETEVNRLKEIFERDSTLPMRLHSHTLINFKKYSASINTCLLSIKAKPFNFKNYTNLVYCFYVITRRKLQI